MNKIVSGQINELSHKIEFKALIGDSIISRQRYIAKKLEKIKWEWTTWWDDHVYQLQW